jgi:HAD superfamily hydrolase (TIGR01484 family)
MEKYVPELARAQAARGHEVLVFTRDQKRKDCPEYGKPTTQAGVTIMFVPTRGGPDLWKTEIERYVDEIVGYVVYHYSGFDILHGHSFLGGWAAMRVQEVTGGRLFWTPHSTGRYKEAKTGRSEPNRIHMEDLITSRADVVTVSTQFEADRLRGDYQLGRAEVVVIPPDSDITEPNASDLATAETSVRFWCRERIDVPPILAVGRSDPRKQFAELVELYAGGIWRDYTLHLLMGQRTFQPDPYREKVLGKVDGFGLWGSVCAPPTHSHGMTAAFMRRAARFGGVFVHPCPSETYGMVILEAAKCGLPCIVRAGTAAETVVRHIGHGLSYDGTQEGLERALSKIQADYHTYMEAGATYEEWSWDTHAARLEKLFEKAPKGFIPRFEPTGASPERWMLADFDGTLNGGAETDIIELVEWLEHRGIKLGIVTGRTVERLGEALKLGAGKELDRYSRLIIEAVGGGIWDYRDDGGYVLDKDWNEWLYGSIWLGWVEEIRALGAELPGVEPYTADPHFNPFKASFALYGASAGARLQEKLKGVRCKVLVSHNGAIADVIPIRSGKWPAMRWWMVRRGVNPDAVLYVGDSANDADALSSHPNAAVVSNYTDKLDSGRAPDCRGAYFAERSYAAGVLEAARRSFD